MKSQIRTLGLAVAGWLAMSLALPAQTWIGSGTGGDTSTTGPTTLYGGGANWTGGSAPASSGAVTAVVDFANAGLLDLNGTQSLGTGAGSFGALNVFDAFVTNGTMQIGMLGGHGSLLFSNSIYHGQFVLAQSNRALVTALILDSTLNSSGILLDLSKPMVSGNIATAQVVAVNSTLIGTVRAGEGVGSSGLLGGSHLILSNSVLHSGSIRLPRNFQAVFVNSTVTNVDFIGGAEMNVRATNTTLIVRGTLGSLVMGGLGTPARIVVEGGQFTVNASALVGHSTDTVNPHSGELTLVNSTNANNRIAGSQFRVGGASSVKHSGTLSLTNSFLRVNNMEVGLLGTGRVQLVNSTLANEGKVLFTTNATFVAENSTIEMSSGTFDNRMQDIAAWEGATGLTLRVIGVLTTNRLEAASGDFGANDGMFANNFALGTLILSNHPCCNFSIQPLVLQNLFDNNPALDRPEAVYVHKLIMEGNTILDLNGINLYTFDFVQGPGAQVLNGSVTLVVIPEAGQAAMALLGLLVVGWWQRRHRT